VQRVEQTKVGELLSGAHSQRVYRRRSGDFKELVHESRIRKQMADAIQCQEATTLIIIKVIIGFFEVKQLDANSPFQCLDFGTHALYPLTQLPFGLLVILR
jgi:hypothetical protein